MLVIELWLWKVLVRVIVRIGITVHNNFYTSYN